MAKARPDETHSGPHHPTISPQLALKKLQKLLEQIPEARASGHGSASFSTWEGNVKIVLSEFYGQSSLVFHQFGRIWFSPGAYYHGQPDSEFVEAFDKGLNRATGFLESRVSDLRETKQTVARFPERLGLRAIILHEQPNKGATIIEKFEANSDVGFAVVLLTPDDVGGVTSEVPKLNPRARQNVVFELGYFVGKLGRHRVCALHASDVEIPSDFQGVVYIPYDGEEGGWKLKVAGELRAAGMDIDLNSV